MGWNGGRLAEWWTRDGMVDEGRNGDEMQGQWIGGCLKKWLMFNRMGWWTIDGMVDG